MNKFFRVFQNEVLCYLSDTVVLSANLQFDRYLCVVGLRLGGFVKFGLYDFVLEISEFEQSFLYGDDDTV